MVLESWYSHDEKLDDAQQQYVDLIQSIFRVRDQLNRPIDYEVTPYQEEYHANSLNVLLDDSKHILWEKARGVSFTWSSLIELIMTAATFENQVIPVISQREKGAEDIVNYGKWLIENAKVPEIRNGFEFTANSKEIRHKKTRSRIVPFPSSSAADAIRSYRCIRGLIDEYAFQQRAKELWTAARETMQGDIGQWIIGSTANGRMNEFYEMVMKARTNADNMGFKLMSLPVFDPEKFDPKTPIQEQDLTPIAPWISLSNLESKRQDITSFMQENMCAFDNDKSSLISYDAVAKQVRPKLVNYYEEWLKNPAGKYETKNNIYIGVDVALSGDLFSVSAFEKVKHDDEYYYVQRWLAYMNFEEYPEAEDFVRNVIDYLSTIGEVRIDANGIGEALPGYLKKDYGNKIVGVKGSQNILVGQGKNTQKIKAKTLMCTNMKRLVETGKVFFLENSTQVTHMTGVDKTFKAKRSKDGHSDIFFSNALALLPSTTRFEEYSNELYVRRTSDSRGDKSQWNDMSPNEKIKHFARERKKRMQFR